MSVEINQIQNAADELRQSLNALLASIGNVPIGTTNQFPYGWRKAAKGRTVWRLLEEIISQNLEARAADFGFTDYSPAESEIGVYDFRYLASNGLDVYVNIKSAVSGGRANKDDISKAISLRNFFNEKDPCCLLVATVEIEFLEDPLSISLVNCYVVPVSWLPDIYVNPSNNGNLQSSKYKDLDNAVRRTSSDFLQALNAEIEVAEQKRQANRALKSS